MAKLKAVSRRGFVSLAGKTLLGASAALSMRRLSFGEGASPGNERPNIIVFLTDDLGWGDLSCYGHPIIKSPNLDRLAQQGMRLAACYSASSVCSPSRSAILTGRTPYRNGVFTWIPAGSPIHLRPTEITVAKLLKGIGYATCHVGKWHLNGMFNSPEQPQPTDHGYEHWLATQNNAHPSHKNPDNFVRNGEPLGPLEGFAAVLVVEEAIDWLKKRSNRAGPFFLTVWTHEPHLPIESDPQFIAMYPDLEDPNHAQHHANVTQLDHAFGMLMKALDDMNLAKNTLVIFTSDNGPEGDGTRGRTRGSTGGLRGRKRAMYEGGIRVPGIVRWPGHVKPGSESDEPIVGSDIFTTVCDIVGIPVPTDRTIDGASMLSAFAGKPIERQLPMYWRYHGAPGPKIAMREGDWKILASAELDQFELYNLKEDLQEANDLVAQEPRRFEAMKQALLQLNAQIEAEGPDWWKGYGQQRSRQQRPIEKGIDKTSTFDVTMGCTVTKSELGYELDADWEGFALKKLEKPFTRRAAFRLQYKTLTHATTKNGLLAFGPDEKNENLVKCGTLMGMGAHGIFVGPFENHNVGSKLPAEFDKSKLFDATVTVDLEAGTVVLEIDGEKLQSRLPEGMKEIRYYGYYAKNTQTSFSPITVEEGQ